MEMNAELLIQLTKIIEEQNNKQTELITKQLNKEITEIKQLLSVEKEKVQTLQKEVEELKSRNIILEKQQRNNNILVFNSGFVQGDLLKYTITLLNNALQINITDKDINDIYRVGNKEENKPILVKFVSFLTKKDILKNCYRLKDSNLNIAEDLSQKERAVRKVLVKHLKIEKAKDKKAHIYKDTLFVEGEAFKFSDLVRKEKDTKNAENLTKPENPKIKEPTNNEVTSNNKRKISQESLLDSSPKRSFLDSHNIRSSARLNNKNSSK